MSSPDVRIVPRVLTLLSKERNTKKSERLQLQLTEWAKKQTIRISVNIQ